MSIRRLHLALLLTLLPFAPLRAQDDELPPDEAADIVDRYIERGIESLREGNFEEARLRFQKALKRDPKSAEARLGVVRCYRSTGAYEKAQGQIEALLEAHPGNRTGMVLLAELDLVQGRHTAARRRLEKVLADPKPDPDLDGLRARVLLAEALRQRGLRDEARTALDPFLSYYRKRYDVWNQAAFDVGELRRDAARAWPLSKELTLVARALRIYVELSPLDYPYVENAMDLVGWARDLDEDNWDAQIEFVRVSRVERERAIARARKIKKIADQRNPELADLYVEVARSVLISWNESEARGYAETALRINPRQTDARAIVARTKLEDNEYAAAEIHIEAGLEVNPRHRDLLALRATLRLLRGDEEGFEKGISDVFAVDPTYGEAFHIAALVVASRQRRYDTAVSLLRRGLKVDGTNSQAQATLGVFLANLGRAEEAREVLVESSRALPYSHPIRDNFRLVLDYVIGTMTEQRTGHFVIRYDPSEHEILSRFMPQLLEGCWADMVERYEFEPRTPVLVEVFRKADDFSVRTLGLPGIPALGACFGGLITLDSPQAVKGKEVQGQPEEGGFLWASTARHEFAHVMSLQLSGGQVPRWFTEGLSVLEEKPLDTGWGLDAGFERQLFDAYTTGTLPGIATFDAMFRSPRVAYAYYVGGLMLQLLKEHSGEEGIVKALRLYGENRPMGAVFREAFGLDLDEFDRLFRESVAKRVARYKLVPNYAPLLVKLMRAVRTNPEDGAARLKLAWAYFQRGQVIDAGAALDRARKLLGADDRGTVLLDAYLQLRSRRADKARALFESFLEKGGEDYRAFMTLASFAARENRDDALVDYLERAKRAWPVEAGGNSPYVLLRRHYMGKAQYDKALAEAEQQARIRSMSIGLRLLLSREYVRAGRDADALRVMNEALRITTFDRRIHSTMLPLLKKSGKKKEAVRAARCVVALRTEEDADEQVAGWYLDLAEVLAEDGRGEEAVAALEEAKKHADAEDLPRLAEVEKKLIPTGQ